MTQPTVQTAESPTLARLLDALQWRPETFARRLNAFARANQCNRRIHEKTPYKWLRGVQPHSPWPTLVAGLLTQELGEPITAARLGWRDKTALRDLPANAGLLLPWTADGTLRAIREVADPQGMDRRLFLVMTATAVTTPALEWLLAPPTEALPRTTGARLELDVVDRLDDITARLRQMDDRLGSGSLLTLVGAHLRYVEQMLGTRHYTDTVGRRLHATTAEILRLSGWLAFDAGQHAQAQRSFLAALHAAHTAGDRALGANILGFMSCQAKDLGHYHEAITLANTARHGYPGATPAVAAILHLRAAEAYANTGDTTECRRALDAAFERLRDRNPEHGRPGWAYWLDEAQAHGQAGYCYLRLDDAARAQGHLTRAVQLQDPSCSREGALRQTLLATAYASRSNPDPERACAIGSDAVDLLTDQVDSARCVGHVHRLLQRLAPYRQPAVRDFTERARQLLALGVA